MTFRYSVFPLFLFAAALIVVGCDQGNQNPDFTTGDTYIINQPGSAVGDASKTSATVPDTVDFVVQAFTIEKDYTWTVNGEEPPVQTAEDQTHVWSAEKRGPEGVGEFISLVFGPDDPLATTDAPETTHSITVDASPDDIDPRTIEVTATIPNITDQLTRLASFSTLAGLATSSDVASVLAESGPFTLLGPRNAALSGLDPAPTQATDDDEPLTSSVLGDLLKYHAIPASVASSDISDGDTVPTLLGDQTLTFNASGGAITVDGAQVVQPDVPVTNGSLHRIDGLLTPSTASIDFTDRTPDGVAAGDTITVDGSFFPADVDQNGGGFVVLHDSTELANGDVIGSIIGKSEYVSPGVQNEVEVVLDEAVSDTTTVGAMAHRDTNGNQTYDFEATSGAEDGPYTLSGNAVIDFGVIRPPEN